MSDKHVPNQDELAAEEIERRRDKIARRMLNTPPKRRAPLPAKGTARDFRTFDRALSANEVSALYAGTSSL